MKKLISVTCAAFAVFAGNSLAADLIDTGIKQTVRVCINVEGEEKADGFYAGFTSDDTFDSSLMHSTSTVKNGSACEQHVYSKGPKNIKVFVYGKLRLINTYVRVNADKSCAFLTQSDDKNFDSAYMPTSKPNEVWTFSLKQGEPQNGFRYNYSMSCTHTSS